MEYGEIDLSLLLKQSPPSTTTNPSFLRYIFHQMLLSVQTVHSRKIVHCDLKPANFLLVRGKLKLIDFGISKTIQNDTTNIVRENQVGTVNYMSPEALRESANTSTVKGRIKVSCLALLYLHRLEDNQMYGHWGAFCMKWSLEHHHLPNSPSSKDCNISRMKITALNIHRTS